MRTISSVVALSIASAASAQAPRELDLLLKPRMADTAMSHVGVRMVVDRQRATFVERVADVVDEHEIG